MFEGKLRDFQVEGVEFGLDSPYHINGYTVGLGKTPMALYLASQYRVDTLIIVPAYLKPNWEDEIKKFLPDPNFKITLMSYSQLAKWGRFKVNINPKTGKKNKQYLGLASGLSRFDFIITDEAQYLKNFQTAIRTKIFHDYVSTCRPKFMSLLTGTAVKNRPSEFWSPLQLCHKGGKYPEFDPYDRLYFKFCNRFSYERTFEANGVPIVRFDGVRRAPELRALISPVYTRKRAEDIEELPEFSEIWIKGKFKGEYAKNLEEAFHLFGQDSTDPAYMSMKRANAMAKVKDTIAVAREIMDQGEKVVIFSDHVAPAEAIAKALKIPIATGKVPGEVRGQLVRDFEANKHQGVSATIGSLSTGVTMVSARHMVFNDVPFVPADLEQAQARIRRIGQTKKCFYHFIYNSEFDKKLVTMIRRKQRDIRKIYD